MFSLFQKKPAPISLEQQLKTLADCGITLSAQATLGDILGHHARAAYEAAPFKELIPVLGMEIERDDFAPLCARLWMCDYERIEDPGAYAEIIARLHQMSAQCLPITGITGDVDFAGGKAWVAFGLAGTRVHWDAVVDKDWMDPGIVVKFDQLLKAQRAPVRIYSNHTDFGQSAFFACLSTAEFERFRKLATFKLAEIEKQA